MTPLRVVIADDEPDVRRLLQVQVGMDEDFEVVGSATNGAEALELCVRYRPDAVVMDLLMPDMNGFAAINALRRAVPRLGIVAYTGVAGSYVRSEMDRLGIEVVLKTGSIGPLLDALRRSVEGGRRQTSPDARGPDRQT